CVVNRVLPSGQLDVVAGTGTCARGNDSGPATTISIDSPRGLALDEPGHTLYITEHGVCGQNVNVSNCFVRALDLSVNVMFIVACSSNGGGGPGADGWP